MFHIYRGKTCLTQAVLPALFAVSESLACQDPSFVCQERSWNRASVRYSMHSLSPALTFPPVSERFFLSCSARRRCVAVRVSWGTESWGSNQGFLEAQVWCQVLKVLTFSFSRSILYSFSPGAVAQLCRSPSTRSGGLGFLSATSLLQSNLASGRPAAPSENRLRRDDPPGHSGAGGERPLPGPGGTRTRAAPPAPARPRGGRSRRQPAGAAAGGAAAARGPLARRGSCCLRGGRRARSPLAARRAARRARSWPSAPPPAAGDTLVPCRRAVSLRVHPVRPGGGLGGAARVSRKRFRPRAAFCCAVGLCSQQTGLCLGLPGVTVMFLLTVQSLERSAVVWCWEGAPVWGAVPCAGVETRSCPCVPRGEMRK